MEVPRGHLATRQDGDQGPEGQHHDLRGPGVLRGAIWLRKMALMGLCVCVGAQVESDGPCAPGK